MKDGGRVRGQSMLPSYANRVRAEWLAMLIDALLVTLSYSLVLMIRYDGAVPTEAWRDELRFLPFAITGFILSGWAFGLYTHVWRHASVLEARRLLLSGGAATLVLAVGVWLGPRLVPLAVAIGGGVLTTGMMGAVRYQSRLFSRRRLEAEGRGPRAVIVGAGTTGAGLARQMLQGSTAGLTPVAFVDDDPRLAGKQVLGVPVVGDSTDLTRAIRDFEATQVIIAVPSAPATLVRRVTDQAETCGVAIRLVPALEDIVRTGLRLQDVRQVKIDDLLGRDPVDTDLASVEALLRGRRVLITGAGGSIGSEIARQVAHFGPAELLLLDHDETHLHDLSTGLKAPHLDLLADIRDRDRVVRIFERHRPEVVFHAAAHKHVPMLEAHPSEAVRTNIVGTHNLLEAARQVGVGAFVLISTDKAVFPSSVMGASKRVAEYLTIDTARQTDGRYTAVRFGNVLGSRGSVVPTFAQQIEAGGPVTVTDANMTRYFMSIPEAVQLVLQAAALSRGGEIYMLDMGEPVSIMELARRMIRLSGRRVGADVEIRVVGTRPGEKLAEELHVPSEEPAPTEHPAIRRLTPREVSSAGLRSAVMELRRHAFVDDDTTVRHLLFDTADDPSHVALPSAAGEDLTIDLTQKDSWTPSTF